MTEERFLEIMESNIADIPEECNVFLGLKIITKYCPKDGIEGASHDVVFSVSVDKLLKAGITEDDVIELRKLNWMIDEYNEGLACFV